MLQDVAVNVSIVRNSENIPCSRKIELLYVYLDQLQLAFFETNSAENPPSKEEIDVARELVSRIERCLYYLKMEEEAM